MGQYKTVDRPDGSWSYTFIWGIEKLGGTGKAKSLQLFRCTRISINRNLSSYHNWQLAILAHNILPMSLAYDLIPVRIGMAHLQLISAHFLYCILGTGKLSSRQTNNQMLLAVWRFPYLVSFDFRCAMRAVYDFMRPKPLIGNRHSFLTFRTLDWQHSFFVHNSANYTPVNNSERLQM